MHSFHHVTDGRFGLFADLQISLQFGQINCLTGPNGSGKSTLVQLLHSRAIDSGIHVIAMDQQSHTRLARPTESPGQAQLRILTSLFDGTGRGSGTLFLLDEPGNHLDQSGFSMLADWLTSCKGAILVVTHDRRLLELAHRILYLEKGEFTIFGGGYDLFQQSRAREGAARARDRELAQKKVKKAKAGLGRAMERQAKRSNLAAKKNEGQKNPKAMIHYLEDRADRTAGRLNRSHGARVDRMKDELNRAREGLAALPAGRRFQLNASIKESDIDGYLELIRVGGRGGDWFSQGETLNLLLQKGEKMAVTGPTGSGKSTLLRIMAGLDRPVTGKRIYRGGEPLLIDQDLSLLDSNHTPMYDLKRRTGLPEKEVLFRLHSWGFDQTNLHQTCGSLSGGERMRLALAVAFFTGTGLLLLDEPTNDLDEGARLVLTEILQQFPGMVVVVSHDPHFLSDLGILRVVDLSSSP